MPNDLSTTRTALQQLAVHVLARRRHAVTGRFGLRPTPGGVGTPAFGQDELEVVRTSGRFLVVERGSAVTVEPITTLGAAAELVGVDLTADFSVGSDTPEQLPADEPLEVDDDAARLLGEWWAFGLTVLDEAVSGGVSSVAQLWPEHFDIGCTVELGGESVNLGASPGDSSEATPYLYVGPWSNERPGDAAYWNAPFGAVLTAANLADLAPADRCARARAFVTDGLSRF